MSIEITNVTKSFGKTKVLDELNLTAESGSITAILGPSGCGKTTLLRCIAGFEAIDSGEIKVANQICATGTMQLKPQRRRISVVPQETVLFPHLNIAKNIGFGLTKPDPKWIDELLDLVGLSNYAKQLPHQISGGQQQRAALARALAPRPNVIVLDEPFSALDTALRNQIRQEVHQILKASKTTALLVTHDQAEALSFADQVALMGAGKVLQQAAPIEIYLNPVSIEVANAIGESILIPATATGNQASTPIGNIQLHQPASGTGQVLLRPEQILLSRNETNPVTVNKTIFYGNTTQVEITSNGLTINCNHPGLLPLPPLGISVSGRGVFFKK